MTTGALVFMAMSWAAVLGVAAWAYARVLRNGSGRNRNGS